MPLPTITMSASAGSSWVVRWPRRNSLGSLCQKDLVDVGVGREARTCFIAIAGGIDEVEAGLTVDIECWRFI